jgi:hypothetical protein
VTTHKRGHPSDERCAACVRELAPALRRAFAVRVWTEVSRGRDLKETLLLLAPGTVLEEAR